MIPAFQAGDLVSSTDVCVMISDYIKELEAYLLESYAYREKYIPIIYRMNQLCKVKTKLRSKFCNKCKALVVKKKDSKGINMFRSVCCNRLLNEQDCK